MVRLLVHDANVVKDGPVGFHTMPNAIFYSFNLDAQLIAMLGKTLSGRIIGNLTSNACLHSYLIQMPVYHAVYLLVPTIRTECQPAVLLHIPVDNGLGFGLDGKVNQVSTTSALMGFVTHILHIRLVFEVIFHQIAQVDAS